MCFYTDSSVCGCVCECVCWYIGNLKGTLRIDLIATGSNIGTNNKVFFSQMIITVNLVECGGGSEHGSEFRL